MINVSKFFNPDASEQWFNTPTVILEGRSIHQMLEEHGYSIIDRDTLDSDYADLQAPIDMIDLSYASSIAVPASGYKNVFISGYAWEVRKVYFGEALVPDILDKWMHAMPEENKYLVSFEPDNYLVAQSRSISFWEIFEITKQWSIDCIIGVFDNSNKVMLVFAEEFGLIYVGFKPDNVPEEFNAVSRAFDKVLEQGYVQDSWDRGVGQRHRLEEFFEQAVKPFT